MLDGYRAALVVPLVAVLVGAVLTATGLRRTSGGAVATAGDEVRDGLAADVAPQPSVAPAGEAA
jgi:hypothetical protein